MYYKVKRIINWHIDKIRFNLYLYVLKQFGINIVYNSKDNKSLSKKYFNVLYISESPAYAEGLGWFERDYEYDLEVSYRSKSSAKSIVSPGSIYPLVDVFCRKNSDVVESRDNEIVMILSEKQFLPGHVFRHEVFKEYKDDKIFDFYGKGASRSIDDVSSVYRNSRYIVVIENFKDEKYASEKIYDAIWSGAVPIYYGATDKLKEDGFNLEGVIFIDDLSSLKKIVEEIKLNPIKIFNEKRKAIEFNCDLINKIRSNAVESFIKNIVICQFVRAEEQYKTTSGDWGRYIPKKSD